MTDLVKRGWGCWETGPYRPVRGYPSRIFRLADSADADNFLKNQGKNKKLSASAVSAGARAPRDGLPEAAGAPTHTPHADYWAERAQRRRREQAQTWATQVVISAEAG